VPASLKKVYWRLAVMVVASCVLLAVAISWLEAISGIGWLNDIVAGFALGTLFQQPILAGAWAALGSGTSSFRLMFSCAWTNAIGLACTLGILSQPGAEDWLMLWATILVVWVLTLVLLGLVRMLMHVRLLPAEFRQTGANRTGQFGLRQLCLLTAIVSVLLGLARWIVVSGWFTQYLTESGPFMGFLFGSLLVLSLPCLLAAFLPTRRQLLWGTLAGLVFAVVVTVAELPLWWKLLGTTSWPEVFLMVMLNAFSLLWVAIFALIVRTSGYRFRSAAELAVTVVEPHARTSAE
jgi:hypothetical protein